MTNVPSRYEPVRLPVSPSTRRIAPETSAPDWRTMKRQAFSPLLLSVGMVQTPAMDGASPRGASVGVVGRARKGYGLRVPRTYCPSSRPSA